jgi:hypothetical protein
MGGRISVRAYRRVTHSTEIQMSKQQTQTTAPRTTPAKATPVTGTSKKTRTVGRTLDEKQLKQIGGGGIPVGRW